MTKPASTSIISPPPPVTNTGQPPADNGSAAPKKKAKSMTDPVLLAVSRVERALREVPPNLRKWVFEYMKAKYQDSQEVSP